ncbi:MAG: serine/threonine protein kinase, partial [Chloroflexi bacterium]
MRRDLIGETLLNQFRIETFIAAGGMATVYRVWDLQRSVPLAMKVLHPELAEDPAFITRFEREAHSLQMLIHPNIVPFYGLFRDNGLTFLLERYIDGPTLDEVLRWQAGRPMAMVDALVYFKAMYTSLGYAHAQGIIHCDVKPGNVLIDQGGHVYLTDFGIARYMDAAVTTSSGLGTPLYMPPEQIRGERLTARADIYALGILLFELLTGARPFRGDVDVPPGMEDSQSDRVRYQQLYVPPPDPRSINPQVPAGLAQVVLSALDKDPDQRYPNVQAMANEIAGVVAARFETLPDRVRLPQEMLRHGAAWESESPPEEEMRETATGPGNSAVGWEWEPEPAYGGPGDTLPGQPPSPRPLPDRPAAGSIPTRPLARISGRLIGLLAALALLTLCGLVSLNLLRGLGQG